MTCSVLLDLDGTLIDSYPGILASCLAALRALGHEPDEALDILPSERNYRDVPLMELMNDYEAAREETIWLLRMLDEDDWERRGVHPYRGGISVHDIVRALHEHDLEHLYQARRLNEAARQIFVPSRRRR